MIFVLVRDVRELCGCTTFESTTVSLDFLFCLFARFYFLFAYYDALKDHVSSLINALHPFACRPTQQTNVHTLYST